MIIKKEFYNIKCDCCGQHIDEQYWDEPDYPESLVNVCGWKATEDEKHYCMDCFEWDDDDRLVTKDGHIYDSELYPIEK